jgi:hypothetical protein
MFGSDGMLEDTRIYTGSGRMSLRLVTVVSHVTNTEVCSRGYKRAREGRSLKSLVKVKWS